MSIDPPPDLELFCLGVPAARVGGEAAPREVLWRTHFALLAHLALAPDRARARSHLIGLLWPEKPDEHARRSLNEAVRRLRTVLGEARLITDGDSLRLAAEGLTVDVTEFESACARGDLRALESQRGEFLEGLHLDAAPDFDAWVDRQRQHCRELAIELLVARAEEQLAVNRCVEARALALRALAIEPLREPSASIAMRRAALDGDTAGSLAIYHAFAKRLEREIGERPGAELLALAARIRSERWRRRGADTATREAPLVGRRDTHARLFAALERLGRHGRCGVVISGDPSSGRTRLLDTCGERLALSGAVVAAAHLLESDHDAPWSTLRTLMRGGLAGAPGIAGTDHLGLRALAAIVPELAARVPPLDAPDTAQLVDGLSSLLGAIADERPAALMIDDAQWADRATLGLLRAVWMHERERPVALVITIDAGVPLTLEAQALIAALTRDATGLEIRLEPLASDDLLALVEAMAPWCTSTDERARLARRVESESGGNPFLAETLLRDLTRAVERDGRHEWLHAGSTHDAPLPISLPGALRSAIATRVARLDDDSVAVLRAASVAGEVLRPELITDVLEMQRSRVDAAIERLERERLVAFDGERYAFHGRLVPTVIERECIQPGGRRRLRERYIEALAGRDELDLLLLRARLLGADGRPEAFELALHVAERAADIGATRTVAAAVAVADAAAAGNRERQVRLADLRRPHARPAAVMGE